MRPRSSCLRPDRHTADHLSHALGDDDFVDSNHLTVKGQERFRSLVMGKCSISFVTSIIKGSELLSN